MNDEYYIRFSDKQKQILVIPAGDTNNDTSLTLFGRGTVDWGGMFTQNMLSLLENFCNYYPPGYANQILPGQLWYSTKTDTLKLCTNSNPLTWTDVANADPVILTNVVTTLNFSTLMKDHIPLRGSNTRLTGELILASVTKGTPFYQLATKQYVHNLAKKFNKFSAGENAKIAGDKILSTIHLPDMFDDINNCATKGYIDNIAKMTQSNVATTVTANGGGVVTDAMVTRTRLTGGSYFITITGTLTFKTPHKKCTLTLPSSYSGLYYCLISGGIRPIDPAHDVTNDITFTVISQNKIALMRTTTTFDETVFFTINGLCNDSIKTTIDESITLTVDSAPYTTYKQLSAALHTNGLPLSEVRYEWYDLKDTVNEVSVGPQFTANRPGDYIVTATFLDGTDNTHTLASNTINIASSVDRAGKVDIRYKLTETKPYLPVLTADIQDADMPITPVSYQWLFDPTSATSITPMSNATNDVLMPNEYGFYQVNAVYNDGQGKVNAVKSPPFELKALDFDVPGDVKVSGFNGIKFVQTATLTDLNRTDPAYPITYNWYKVSNLKTPAGTGETFTPKTVGKYRVVVNYTDSISDNQTATSNDFEIFLTPSNIAGVVTITGSNILGGALTASLVDGNISDPNAVIAWQWYKVDIDGTNAEIITSATRSTFTPTKDQGVGYYMARATYNDDVHVGAKKEVADSAPFEMKLSPDNLGKITLTGKKQINSTIIATLNDSDEPKNIEWFWTNPDNDIDPAGASTSTVSTYMPTVAGAYNVRVEYTDKYNLDVTNKAAAEILNVTITETNNDGLLEIYHEGTNVLLFVDSSYVDPNGGSAKLYYTTTGQKLTALIKDIDVPLTSIAYTWTDPAGKSTASSIILADAPGMYTCTCTYTDTIPSGSTTQQISESVTQLVRVGDIVGQPSIGDAFSDGFYAGDIYNNGVIYQLVVAPASTQILNVANENLFVDVSSTTSLEDAGTHTCWGIPTQYEALVMYENLKPTNAANDTGYDSNNANSNNINAARFDNERPPQINPYSVPPRWESYDTDLTGRPQQTKVARFKEFGNQSTGEDQSFKATGAYLTKTNYVSFGNGKITATAESVNIRYVRRVVKPAVTISGILETQSTLYAVLIGIPFTTVQYDWYEVDTTKNGAKTVKQQNSDEFNTPNTRAVYSVTATYSYLDEMGVTKQAVLDSTPVTVIAPGDMYGGGAYIGQLVDNGMVYRLIRATETDRTSNNVTVKTPKFSSPWITSDDITKLKAKDEFPTPLYVWEQPTVLNYTYGYLTTYLQSKYPKLAAAQKICAANLKASKDKTGKTGYSDWYLPTAWEISFARIQANSASTANQPLDALHKAYQQFNMFYSVQSDSNLKKVDVTQAWNAATESTNFKYNVRYDAVGVDIAGNGWYFDTKAATAYVNQTDPAYLSAITNFKDRYKTVMRQTRIHVEDGSAVVYRMKATKVYDAAATQKALDAINKAHAAWQAAQPDANNITTFKRYDWGGTSTTWWPFRREIIYNTLGMPITVPTEFTNGFGQLRSGGYNILAWNEKLFGASLSYIQKYLAGYSTYNASKTAVLVSALRSIGQKEFTTRTSTLTAATLFSTHLTEAVSFGASLSTVINTVTYDDWRLPSKNEMVEMVAASASNELVSDSWQRGGLAAIDAPAIYWVIDNAGTVDPSNMYGSAANVKPYAFVTQQQLQGQFITLGLPAAEPIKIGATNVHAIPLTAIEYKASNLPIYARVVRVQVN
jgi:hypothetical protein